MVIFGSTFFTSRKRTRMGSRKEDIMAKKVKYTICDCGNPAGHVGPVWHMGQPIPDNVELVDPSKILIGGQQKAKIKSIEFQNVVLRCGCGNPDSHSKLDPPRPCPTPRKTVDHGTVSYYHRNPLKRVKWWLSRRFIERRLRQEGEYA